MNPEFKFNSSSSSRHFLDLNEDYIPGCEQYYYGCLSSYTNNIPAAAISQQHQDQPTASSTNYFNLSQDYQSKSRQPKVVAKKIAVVEGSSSSTGHLFSASSHQETNKDSSTEDHMKTIDHEKRSTSTNDHGSTKWMSSKMRAMRKMLRSSGTDHHLYIPATSNSDYNQINSDDNCNSSSTTAEVVRVCSDCKTTKTPLWRGGPQGPKSLCNACGIRRRKARKAMALAAAAAQNDSDIVLKMDHCTSAGALKILNHKDKKSRKSHHDAKQSGLQTSAKTKLSFEEFATSFLNRKSNEMFPQDEEEAAVLLMALSCGLIHH